MKKMLKLVAIAVVAMGVLVIGPAVMACAGLEGSSTQESATGTQESLTETQEAGTQETSHMEGIMKWHEAVFGTLTAINGTTLTVTDKDGKVFTVDAANASVIVDGQKSTLSSLAVNDKVFVFGTPSSTDSTQIAAKVIGKGIKKMEQGPDKFAGLFGEITAISGTTLTVKGKDGIIYTVDAASAKVTVDGKVSTLTDLAVGDKVVVKSAEKIAAGTTQVTATAISKGFPKIAPLKKAFKKGFKMGRGMHKGMKKGGK